MYTREAKSTTVHFCTVAFRACLVHIFTPAWLPYCMTLCPRTIFKSSAGLANLTSSNIYPDFSILTLQKENLDTGCIENPPWERISDSFMPMKQAALSTTRDPSVVTAICPEHLGSLQHMERGRPRADDFTTIRPHLNAPFHTQLQPAFHWHYT